MILITTVRGVFVGGTTRMTMIADQAFTDVEVSSFHIAK